MDLGLGGKCALITGGSHGIGLAIAKVLAAEGCNIAICSRDKAKLAQAVKELTLAGTEVLAIKADVLKPSAIKKVVSEVSRRFSTIDILINNVGGGGRWGKPVAEDTSEDVWLDVYAKNALAAIRFTLLVIPMMKAHKWGRVVTVSSIHGREAGGRPWFAMAKSAEISLMKTLAKDRSLARSGITFNSVAPGSIMIPGTGWEKEMKANPGKFKKLMEASYPLGRLGNPDEVASAIAFLCSRQATLINGACVVVDGGESNSF